MVHFKVLFLKATSLQGASLLTPGNNLRDNGFTVAICEFETCEIFVKPKSECNHNMPIGIAREKAYRTKCFAIRHFAPVN